MIAALNDDSCDTLRVRNLGRLDYAQAMRVQDAALRARIESGQGGGDLLVVEHPPVYTLGRGADEADLRGAPERTGVPVVRVDRGGGATFHGPGQVVVYPVVRLPGHSRDVRRYVGCLEQALVRTCAAFGVEATARPGQIGVWCEGGKIGSVGIGVRRGVAFHGVALNVCTRLDYFDEIVVCRCSAMSVTSLSAELGVERGARSAHLPSLSQAADALAESIAAELQMEIADGER